MKRDDITITEPCHEDWSAMDGGERKRFCGQCDKHVHDLSAMTEHEAKSMLKTVEKPCVRYTCKPDGSIRFKPSRRVVLARAGMLAGGLMIGGLSAHAGVAPQPTGESCEQSLFDQLSEAFWSLFEDDEPSVMGEIEPEPVLMGQPVITEPVEIEPVEIEMGEIEEITTEEPAPQPVMGRIAPPPEIEEE